MINISYPDERWIKDRYEFYSDGFTDKVCNYLTNINNLNYKELSTVNFKLRDLGELEDALIVIKNSTGETVDCKELVNAIGGLIKKGTMRELLNIHQTIEISEGILESRQDLNTAELTLDITLARQKLVEKIEKELGITIDILDLLITAV